MSGVWQDIRFALRSQLKAPGFALVVVLILAVGIGANVAMFSIVDSALLRPVSFPEPERLVLGRATYNGNVGPLVSAQDYWDYRDMSRSFVSLDAYVGFTNSYAITGIAEPERIAGILVTVDLFRTLGVNPQLGRHFAAEEASEGGPDAVIISHGYWQRRFGGSPDAVGRTLTVDGYPCTIVGVMPAGFRIGFDAEFWRPMRPDSPYTQYRRWHNWLLVGRLKPGVDIEQAQVEVDVISAQLEAEYPDSNTGKALLLTDLRGAVVESYRDSLLLLMGAVALVLLIACGNVAGLLLARGSARRAELSLRAALGASGSRLLRQLLTESLVLAVVAGVLGTLLAGWFQDLLVRPVSLGLPNALSAELSGSALGFALLLSLATGLLFGAAPALRASRREVVEDLKSGARTTDAGGARFRSGLVVAQVAISIMLLIGAGLLMRSFASVTGVDPGFRPGKLLTAEMQLPGTEYGELERRIQFYSGLQERIQAIPGVEGVTLADRLPIRDPGNWLTYYAADNPPLDPADRQGAPFRVVMEGYFQTMDIPLLAGRGIEATDAAGSPLVAVVSQAVVERLWPDENPLGRQVVVDLGAPVTFEVVGVVEDVHLFSLDNQPTPVVYASYYQIPYSSMRVAVRTAGEPGSVAGALREAVWSLDRDIAIARVTTMDEVMASSVNSYRVLAALLAGFAGVAVLLAATGLYSVLAYYVTRRRHEIGVRVALGAGNGAILELVVKRGIVLVALGLAVGLAAAFGLTRVLEGMLFETAPTDPATFVSVSALFALVALVACLIPAWRALRVNPVVALQAE
ncbi:MAG: ABC transporter permease [Gemmatimonadota bacterium]|nr:MAG: ABC transporter permease [Gemmatimonadota bacterium]